MRGKGRLDITGQKFGRLTAIRFSHINHYNEDCWFCICDCGRELIRNGRSMRRGHTTSCGCSRRRKLSKPRIDLTGKKFNKLLVLSLSDRKGKWTFWNCLCDCGKKTLVRCSHLTSGGTRSCGCLKSEVRTIHGKSGSSIHRRWAGMIGRCTNPNDPAYQNYGGRGIKVCKRWNKFVNFYKDMGDPPKGYSLDRIDNSKGYSKKNCRWATPKEQSNNKRRNVLMEYNGKIQTRSQWAVEFGIILETLRGRLKRGWSLGDALSKPPRNRRKP